MSFIEAKISLRSACALRCYNILFQCWLTSSPTLSMTSHAYFHFIALFTIWSLLFGRFHALKLSVLTFKRPQRHAGSIGQINRSNVRKQLSLFAINNQKDVTMPALSSTMKQGRVISWNKRVGDAVATGDMLLVVESDKADMDVEAYDSGYLGAIYVAAGETAPVGATLATIVENKQDLALLAGSLPERTDKTPESPQSIGVGKIDTGESKSSELSNKLMGPSFQTINMPALSSTMKEGKVITWNKRIGDKVMSGDILLVVESDKADMDVEAFADGYLAHIVVNEGEKAAVASPVAYLVDRYEDMESFQVFLKTSHSQSLKEDQFISSSQLIPHIQSETNITPSSTPSSVVNNGRIAASGYAKQLAKEKSIDLRTVIPSRSDGYITSKDLMSQSVKKHAVVVSPMAKRLAVEHGVDLSKVTGTGNFGRIIPDDVLRAAGKLTSVDSTVSISKHHSVINPTGEEANRMQVTSLKQLDEVEALTNLQLAVAKNMENSLSVPVFRVSRYVKEISLFYILETD
jgi:pyruvate dehydrogenase E2 component (dihydrolipoamide acetyltransferase)